MNNKINRIHERALKSGYSDYSSNFDELLKKDGQFSIYDRNIQTLAIELYKFFHGLFPSIMKNIFQVNTNNSCSLRSRNEFYCRNPKAVKYGTEIISYLAPKIRSLVAEIIKRTKTCFQKQNKKMETWLPLLSMYDLLATCPFHLI